MSPIKTSELEDEIFEFTELELIDSIGLLGKGATVKIEAP